MSNGEFEFNHGYTWNVPHWCLPITVRFTGDSVPEQQTGGACGYDIRAAEDVVLFENVPTKVPTGLRVAVPFGYHLKVCARSGLGSRGITLGNGVGRIDSDYRGEVFIPMVNVSDQRYKIRAGDRIAQLILEKNIPVHWQHVETLDETERGEGGFGSTGD